MCVDFIDLNKVCTNNSFPLLKIDKLVNSTTEFEFLSSLDSNSKYHKISMYLEDNEKPFFITEEGTFCYRAMPFGLKNTKTTYQWM